MARLSGPLGEALAANAAVRRVAFASGSSRPAALDPALARGIAHALRTSTSYEAMIDATRHITFARGPQVEVPACVVFGDDDRILPAPENQQPEVAPPGARWIVLPHCGHAPMWDAPGPTVELVDQTVRAATSAAT
jgi:pimeloyl-ACP methyl ester carboxylesterase